MIAQLTPDQVKERSLKAFQWWELRHWEQRTHRELELAMGRHGITPIDARAYARDLIAGADHLQPYRIGLQTVHVTAEELLL